MHSWLPEVTAFRSLALTTYAAGPIPEPWIILAVTDFSVDSVSTKNKANYFLA